MIPHTLPALACVMVATFASGFTADIAFGTFHSRDFLHHAHWIAWSIFSVSLLAVAFVAAASVLSELSP